MRLATKTLEAIEQQLVADQGARYRGLLRQAFIEAEEIYKGEDDRFRAHLGASVIGRECARQVWYGFHWVKRASFQGRMLRLFNRGNIEEARLSALLRLIGCTIDIGIDGKQFRFSALNDHFGGSLDGIIYGLPDAPDIHVLGEFKTHNDNSFIKLQQDGVRAAKPEHWVQMICYMDAYQLPLGLYIGSNKNDDDLHAELIEPDPEAARRYVERAGLILDHVPPPRISNTPGWWKCKFCEYRGICFSGEAPSHNCRTCDNVRCQTVNDKWICVKFNRMPLSKDIQQSGCANWVENPNIK